MSNMREVNHFYNSNIDIDHEREEINEIGFVEDSVRYLLAGSVLGFSIVVLADLLPF